MTSLPPVVSQSLLIGQDLVEALCLFDQDVTELPGCLSNTACSRPAPAVQETSDQGLLRMGILQQFPQRDRPIFHNQTTSAVVDLCDTVTVSSFTFRTGRVFRRSIIS